MNNSYSDISAKTQITGEYTLNPATKTVASPATRKSGWEFFWRVVVVLLGVFVGLIIALFVGFGAGWISVGC